MAKKAKWMTDFQAAYAMAERSDVVLHDILCGLVLDWERSKDMTTIQTVVWDFLSNCSNPQGFRALGIKKWLTTTAKFQAVDNVLFQQDNTEYGKEWLEVCKNNPWFKSIKVAKPWHDPYDSMCSQMATGLVMGGITWEELAGLYSGKTLDTINTKVNELKLRMKAEAKCEALKIPSVDIKDLNASFLVNRNPVPGVAVQ